ncbi:unnamed protein product [Ranitomeya imitator]|uniref:Integral membrane protein 2 n=1 Tax=Ranitomeya imitator TaxID=111125 RepID=A0ABN9LUE4_9NEOB|nr:unnamed protein product [Ranitomeya imitator]
MGGPRLDRDAHRTEPQWDRPQRGVYFCGIRYTEDDMSLTEPYAEPRVRYHSFKEKIQILEDEDVELINVPVPEFADSDPADIVHDFHRKLTAYLDLSLNKCYVIPLNTSVVMPPKNFLELLINIKRRCLVTGDLSHRQLSNDAGNKGKHRVTKRRAALSNPMFTLVTIVKVKKNKHYILTFRCLSSALCFPALTVSTAAGKQSGDVTALLSGWPALPVSAEKHSAEDRQRKAGTYLPQSYLIHEQMVVTDRIENVDQLGVFIRRLCQDKETYKLQRRNVIRGKQKRETENCFNIYHFENTFAMETTICNL